MASLTLKLHNFFQSGNNRKATHSFATRSFEIQYLPQFELPRTDLVTNFLNPENQSFENVSIVTFK